MIVPDNNLSCSNWIKRKKPLIEWDISFFTIVIFIFLFFHIYFLHRATQARVLCSGTCNLSNLKVAKTFEDLEKRK